MNLIEVNAINMRLVDVGPPERGTDALYRARWRVVPVGDKPKTMYLNIDHISKIESETEWISLGKTHTGVVVTLAGNEVVEKTHEYPQFVFVCESAQSLVHRIQRGDVTQGDVNNL